MRSHGGNSLQPSATLLHTSGEVPSPRLRHAGAQFDTVLLIWGGATNISDQGEISGPYDDSLYVLDIGTSDLLMSRLTLSLGSSIESVGRRHSQWSRARRSLWPCCDNGLPSSVFSGKVEGKCLNDMWAFDLDSRTFAHRRLDTF